MFSGFGDEKVVLPVMNNGRRFRVELEELVRPFVSLDLRGLVIPESCCVSESIGQAHGGNAHPTHDHPRTLPVESRILFMYSIFLVNSAILAFVVVISSSTWRLDVASALLPPM